MDEPTDFLERCSVRQFIDALSARRATPGGGSAGALIGALGAALVAMVCRIALGRPGAGPATAPLRGLLADADRIAAELAALAADDIAAVDGALAARELPGATAAEMAARSAAVDSAARRLLEVPLACARTCAELLRRCRPAIELAGGHVAADAAAGAYAALAALRIAALNVRVDAPRQADRALATAAAVEVEALLVECAALVDDLQASVLRRLG